jgi:hypothetical protein
MISQIVDDAGENMYIYVFDGFDSVVVSTYPQIFKSHFI